MKKHFFFTFNINLNFSEIPLIYHNVSFGRSFHVEHKYSEIVINVNSEEERLQGGYGQFQSENYKE